MEGFAQTRGADDLFDDEFTPIPESVVQSFVRPPRIPYTQLPAQGGRDGPVSQGRGNRTRDSFSRQQMSQPTPTGPETQTSATSDIQKELASNSSVYTDPSTLLQQDPPPPQPKQSTAVRGDRTATGGTPKPKLTEEELTARLAAVKLNNAKRAEAHRLAEADEASFQQREENASQKSKEEGQAKRIMNMEREKNRLRKLGAQAGREWDEGKEEIDRKEERGSQYRRGAHSGVTYEGGRGGRGGRGGTFTEDEADYHNGDHNQEFQERRGGHRGRGRGDRGRGRGRGGFNPNNNTQRAPPNFVVDFPALPTTWKGAQPSKAPPFDTPPSPAAEGSSWADEVQAARAPA